ncbi:MAG: hypothetical protein ABSF25_06550 [Bryobacteraceae bacterium]
MTSVEEILVQEVARLSEEHAQEVLDLVRAKKKCAVTPERPKLTREELIKRAAGHPGIHAPDPDAPPFEKVEPIETRGIPASRMLIEDRR